MGKGKPKIDMTGFVVGRLTVIALAEAPHMSKPQWLCACQCGRTTNVDGYHLRTAAIRSCGCLRSETTAALYTKHGAARKGHKTRTFHIWECMHDRCRRPSNKCYADYGGRGITVCERWSEYANFHADMGDAPPGMSIDRRDNNGNYEPTNCRWVTRLEQMSNTRRNVFVAHAGERITAAQRDRLLNQPQGTTARAVRAGLLAKHTTE